MIRILSILFINTLDFGILHQYLLCFSKKRRFHSYARIAILGTCIIVLTIINQYQNPSINIFFSCSMIYLYSLSFSYSLSYHLVLPIFYFGTGFVTEPIVLLLTQILCQYFSLNLGYNTAVLLCEIIRFLIIFIICRIWNNVQLPILSSKMSYLLFLIPLPNVVICCTCIYIAQHLNSEIGDLLCLEVIVMILLSSILTFTIFHKLGIVMLNNHKNELLLQEAMTKEKYFKVVEQNNRKIQEIKHNLKNQLLGLSALSEKEKKSNEELKGIIRKLDSCEEKIYTSNNIFNTILNSKIQTAESKGIESNISVLVPRQMNLDYSETGLLVGNLLDNAIEACEKAHPPNRKITINIAYKERMLILKITNSKEAVPAVLDKSSKADSQSHGIGIYSVKEVVKKYNGMIEFEDKGNTFEVSVILYGIV